jgi:hypothetical protein
LEKAFSDIGQEYNKFAMSASVKNNAPFTARIQSIADGYKSSVPLPVPAIQNTVTGIASRAGLSGPQYSTTRTQLVSLQKALKNDPSASGAVRDLIQALDAQAIRSLAAPMRKSALKDMQDRNQRYRNLLAIEDAAGRGAGEGAAIGLISPSALKAAIKLQNKRDYTRGRGSMSDLARAGEGVMKPLPSSGTAERSFAQGVVTAPAASLGIVGGASGGVETGVAAALLPWMTSAATARTIMSKPVQKYLSNQRFQNGVPDEGNKHLRRALAAMIAERGGLLGSLQDGSPQ